MYIGHAPEREARIGRRRYYPTVSSAYLWAPWILVGALLLGLLYRGRRQLDTRRLTVEIALVVSAYAVYFAVRGLTEGSAALAEDHAHAIAGAERAMGVYWEPSMARFVAPRQALASIANWVYIWGHWPLILVMAVWLFLHRPRAYGVYRSAFVVSGVLGLAGFLAYPVAPPRLADPAFVDTLSRYASTYRELEPGGLVNQYAAMPSIHFGWNLLVGVALLTEARSPVVRAFGALIPTAMALSVIVTANHYILDVVAGAGVCIASLAAAKTLDRARHRARPVRDAVGARR
jgi:membrane-associated phospholipid phosphatase